MPVPDFRALRAARLELQKQAGIPANLAAGGVIGVGKGILGGAQSALKGVTGYAIEHPFRAGAMGLGAYGLWKMLSEIRNAAKGSGDYSQYTPMPGSQSMGTF